MKTGRSKVWWVVICLFVAACKEEDAATAIEDIPVAGLLYYNYLISGDNESAATVKLIFRRNSKKSRPVRLQPPAAVFLDGQPLAADSARSSGVYYEASFELPDFSGAHEIRLVDEQGATHTHSFNFKPFRLAQPLPEQIKRAPFELALQNFPEQPTKVYLTIIDNNFDSPDVNTEVMVHNATLKITGAMLQKLSPGAVVMEITWEDERAVNKKGLAGKIMKVYTLRKHFTLVAA